MNACRAVLSSATSEPEAARAELEVVHAEAPEPKKDPWAAAGAGVAGIAGAASGGAGTKQDSITCPNCGTVNPASRDFCRKCATELRPRAAVKHSRLNRGLVARFLVSALVGTAVVVTGAFVLNRIGPAAASVLPSAESIDLVDPSGVPVEFDVRPGDPEPLPALPATATIQLASYEEPAATEGPSGSPSPGRAQWWSDTLPRVPPVTQFDGGPLQRVTASDNAGNPATTSSPPDNSHWLFTGQCLV